MEPSPVLAGKGQSSASRLEIRSTQERAMNHKERFLTAITGGEPDSVPVFELEYSPSAILAIAEHLGWQGPDPKAGPDSEDKDLWLQFQAMHAIMQELDIDAHSYVYTGRTTRLEERPDRFRDELGVVYQESSHGDPIAMEGPVKDADSLKRFHSSLPEAFGLPLLDAMRSEMDERALVFTVPGPFKLGWSLMGSMEGFLLAMAMDEDFTEELCGLAASIAGRLIDQALEQGADAVLIDGDLAFSSNPLISPDDYRRFIKPHHAALIERVHAKNVPVIKHTDGNFWRLLDDFLEVGFDALHPIQPDCMDIEEVKGKAAGRAALIGNIDCVQLLPAGSPSEVEAAVRRTIRAIAPGGGYVLSSSNSIHPGCKPENVVAMLKAAKQHGRYPIGG
jgi:uroporphyrinogen decarboxylase